MDAMALLLSRLQFAFTISFHIIFPAFPIGLAGWLTILEALHLTTGRPAYRVIFEFWLKVFGVAFGPGVVSGVVGIPVRHDLEHARQDVRTDSGALLSYEIEMVALGTTLSAFWIMVNNSWMQVPVGYVVQNDAFVPDDWTKTVLNSVVWVRHTRRGSALGVRRGKMALFLWVKSHPATAPASARRLVGNFPQAFSHIALVNTAHNIADAMKPCEQRSGNARLAEVAE
jgi:hypothetical protein